MITAVVSTVMIAFAAVCAYFAFRPVWRQKRAIKRLSEVGVPELARVVEIEQTGTEINELPLMRLLLELQPAGGTVRRVEIRQLLGLADIPRAGDSVYVMTDPDNPDTVLFAGIPATQPMARVVNKPGAPPQLTEAQTIDLLALTPRLRDHGVWGVATVLAREPAEGLATRFRLEVDSVIEPKREATVTQVMYGGTYAPGERAHLLIDPDDPNVIALAPLSFTHGKKIDPGQHRLDWLVLYPQLLAHGATAQGTVLVAEPRTVNNAELCEKGYQKFLVRLRIVPDDGSPAYESEQELVFTTQEKAQRIATVGAVLPMRYERLDPETWTVDTLAMGLPEPYTEARAAALPRLPQ